MSDPDRRRRILVVDDNIDMAETLAEGLSEHGYAGIAVASGKRAAELLEGDRVDALVTDLRMPDKDGLELLASSQRTAPERPVIIMTAYGAIDTAIESMRRGAAHYLTKPFKLEELLIFLGRALEQADLRREATALKRELRGRDAKRRIVARSKVMKDVLDVVLRVADADSPVLLLGETGTGKGLLAETLHGESERRAAPFVTVNCAALPEPLLESELFGHAKGAFTGATTARSGLFVEADGGTLFLDEVGDMAPPLQAKLLHVLERGMVRPVGGNAERAVDVRIVAATHRDLRARVADGSFREDLLYRLDVVSIDVPPLRERREDLAELVEHFFAAAREKHRGAVAERIGPAAMELFLDYAWPGNVRELAHALERVALLARSASVDISDLPKQLREPPGQTGSAAFSGDVQPLRDIQRAYASWALERLGGHRTRTAEKLEIDRKTLAKLVEQDDGEPASS
jgi:two-component system response regulator HydG